MNLKQNLEFNRGVAKHIDRRRFFGWFIGLALPFTIAMSTFVRWHNGVVGEVRPTHLLLRFGVGMAGYVIILIVVHHTAMRPALKKAQKEIMRRGSSPDP